jgi:DeoR/GlpR family transcriptional regulator of sugar metabolism
MLVAERYEKIVQLVNDRGSVRVSELAALFGVTEETIRRDLAALEQAGRLRRSHGGAVSIRDVNVEIPYFEREVTRAEEKERIAREAVRRIEPHDRILLDASTSAWYMAKHLPDIPLTVLTNSIKVATELAAKEKIDVIASGGRLSPRSLSFVGPQAEASMADYHVDKLFFSCKGVHLERGLSESNDLQARLKRQFIGMAEQVVLLADSSKFGVQAFARIAGLDRVDTIISDRELDDATRDQLSERGIEVVLA